MVKIVDSFSTDFFKKTKFKVAILQKQPYLPTDLIELLEIFWKNMYLRKNLFWDS